MHEYRQHYAPHSIETAVGEVSPSYLYYPEVRHEIVKTIGEVRIIALLRNPIDKAFSQYVHLVREGRETLSFWNGLQKENQRQPP